MGAVFHNETKMSYFQSVLKVGQGQKGLSSFFRNGNPNLCQLKNEIFTSENFHPTIFQPGFKEA